LNPGGSARKERPAEALGDDRLWMVERLLGPVPPQAPNPATADGALPCLSRQRSTP
jgi:hypothetical protein